MFAINRSLTICKTNLNSANLKVLMLRCQKNVTTTCVENVENQTNQSLKMWHKIWKKIKKARQLRKNILNISNSGKWFVFFLFVGFSRHIKGYKEISGLDWILHWVALLLLVAQLPLVELLRTFHFTPIFFISWAVNQASNLKYITHCRVMIHTCNFQTKMKDLLAPRRFLLNF